MKQDKLIEKAEQTIAEAMVGMPEEYCTALLRASFDLLADMLGNQSAAWVADEVVNGRVRDL